MKNTEIKAVLIGAFFLTFMVNLILVARYQRKSFLDKNEEVKLFMHTASAVLLSSIMGGLAFVAFDLLGRATMASRNDQILSWLLGAGFYPLMSIAILAGVSVRKSSLAKLSRLTGNRSER